MLGLEHEQGELTNIYVLAVATWMIIASKRTREFCGDDLQRDDDGPGLLEAYHGPPLWTTGRGFSMPRWEFWKQRFDTLANDGQLSAEVTKKAREAYDAMALDDE